MRGDPGAWQSLVRGSKGFSGLTRARRFLLAEARGVGCSVTGVAWRIGLVTVGVGVSAWRGAEMGTTNTVWGSETSPPFSVRISLPERSVSAIYAKGLPYFQSAIVSVPGESNGQC